jgi:uncharacterized protein DUF4279
MSSSKAGSSRVAELVSSSDNTYETVLRVRHPSLDPAELTDTLRVEPEHCWKAGDPRVSQSGQPIGGQHRDSYWSAPLPVEHVAGAPLSREGALSQQLLSLTTHRDFFKRLQSDGAEVSLVVEIAPAAGLAITLTALSLRRAADLNIEIEFQVVGD